MIRILLFSVVLASCPTIVLARSAESSPTDIAGDYFKAMEQKDLDAAQALFAERSSIFESGGDEGDWAHYRAHHIGTELDAIESFRITLGQAEDEVSLDGGMAFVAWPIEYRIALRDGREIDSRGTVTFVLVRSDGGFLIRHLHWSSGRKQEGAH